MKPVNFPQENEVVMQACSVRPFAGLATLVGLLFAGAYVPMAAAAGAEDEDPAYTRVITERANKIVAPLGIADAEKSTRVRDVIVVQYRSLSRIHDDLDAKIASAKSGPSDPAVAEAWIKAVENKAQLELFALHRAFVARLAAELTPSEVDKVKDSMTYGVVPLTYHGYQELLPDLTAVQKARIHAWLIEAREYAMDAGSSEKKHWWFGKYKGRINNYLSSAGYDLKQAERDLSARKEQAPAP
jgi:hypothetical protein